MRRSDREMSREFGIQVVDKSRYGIISMIDKNNEPYGIPLSIVRDESTLYFHSATDGRKVKIFKESPNVSVVFVGEVNVPQIHTKEELDEILKDESKTGVLVSSVFTTEFESAVVKGKVKLVEDEQEKIKALKLICEKYTPTYMNYFDIAIKSGAIRTNVYRIDIETINAKRKKYDSKGEEMKWRRME
ncbi:pyridoxamine 5'-phosphate oxidase family protein [Tissierella sp. Yu-01]|uniref:pyridoxamine 5'-phosphate oxidase family protein n=1 Tax=Tissierella sp. Yu-01 TaxID=3035694 RepID=UPI00240DF87E|nr:pyridoxamine 5'-phosphate oxidase family protein [Tissierella sp. Yu-01]WFA09025.1 pyridoxamine 5'-phosphate oxidase family protein [Tissierella sp. Yu-01]